MTHDLDRFVQAQNGVYDTALRELRAGRKTSHWMWYIFPQVAGLGRSEMSRRFAIASLDEAVAFLRHPTLGDRLRACADALLAIDGRSAEDILGSIDAVKLRSSMTLFALAAPGEPRWSAVLERYFDSEPDPETVARIDPGTRATSIR